MATAMSPLKPFSIKNFRELFENSSARQFMSNMELEQVRVAIENKDVMLLGQLYDILLKGQMNDQDIVRDFVMAKNRIVDGFMAEATGIEKKISEAPRKEAVSKAEKREQAKAEAMLKKL